MRKQNVVYLLHSIKFNNSQHVINFLFYLFSSHPWETVVQAAWRKYPNPMNTAVIGTDVVERDIKDGVLHSHRIVSSQWHFPKWVEKVSTLLPSPSTFCLIFCITKTSIEDIKKIIQKLKINPQI